MTNNCVSNDRSKEIVYNNVNSNKYLKENIRNRTNSNVEHGRFHNWTIQHNANGDI